MFVDTNQLKALFVKYGLVVLKEEECEEDKFISEDAKLLWLLLTERISNEYKSNDDIIGDWTILNTARMLRQSMGAQGGFSLNFDGWREEYDDGGAIAMQEGLTMLLSSFVEKRELKKGSASIGWCMILSKGYGGADTGRAFLIPYPDGITPQQDGFSNEELKLIIDYEDCKKYMWEKRQGNKSNGTRTKLAVMGEEALFVLHMLDSYGCSGWSSMKKHCFVFDYFILTGMLDYKGSEWIERKRDAMDVDKNREVLHWIEANSKNILMD